MLHDSPSPTSATSQDREGRRQQLLAALRREADVLLERVADELVDLPDDRAFGDLEYTLRDLSHDFAARAHQAGIAAKKRATKAPAASAPTAAATPASSATAPRLG